MKTYEERLYEAKMNLVNYCLSESDDEYLVVLDEGKLMKLATDYRSAFIRLQLSTKMEADRRARFYRAPAPRPNIRLRNPKLAAIAERNARGGN